MQGLEGEAEEKPPCLARRLCAGLDESVADALLGLPSSLPPILEEHTKFKEEFEQQKEQAAQQAHPEQPHAQPRQQPAGARGFGGALPCGPGVASRS